MTMRMDRGRAASRPARHAVALSLAALLVLTGCGNGAERGSVEAAAAAEASDEANAVTTPANATAAAPDQTNQMEETDQARDTAVFAGGCFWCMEPPYDELEGVFSTTSGYAGGHVENPSYEQVTAGGTGHREVVQVVYDPAEVGYGTLLDVFWRNVDPLDDGGQFCDRGFSYTTAIFAADEEQAEQARVSKERVARRFEEPVVTPLVTEWEFYPAEQYHQNYYEKNPLRYKFYRFSCGRDGRLEELWGE